MFLPSSERYALQIRVPMSFAEALKEVASREMMTLSGLIRHALFEHLRAKGINPTTLIDDDARETAA